jgi:hypothetical protein
MDFSYEFIDIAPPQKAIVFHGEMTYEQKVRVKVRECYYGEHGIKFVCPICDSISSVKPFSLCGEDKCPCCGVNLWYGVDK